MRAIVPIRLLAWSLALALLALPLVGLFMGWFASDHWPVRSLRVDGNLTHVRASDVRDHVRPMLEAGFFAVDPGAIRQAVAGLPWVDAVEVRRQWPDQVLILIREHQAFARWNDHGLIDRRGQLFRVAHSADLALPQLRGPDDSVRSVVQFFLDARRAFEPLGITVTGTDLDPRGTWHLALAGGGRVTVGKVAPRRRLQRFVAGFGQLVHVRGTQFISADLRYSNGFAVHWPVPAATQGDPPKA